MTYIPTGGKDKFSFIDWLAEKVSNTLVEPSSNNNVKVEIEILPGKYVDIEMTKELHNGLLFYHSANTHKPEKLGQPKNIYQHQYDQEPIEPDPSDIISFRRY